MVCELICFLIFVGDLKCYCTVLRVIYFSVELVNCGRRQEALKRREGSTTAKILK
jgi:hypothetical protein